MDSGLEADQKVLAAHGCYAMTATTALTAQNTTGVKDIHVVPAAFVEKQVEACVQDIPVNVVKTGPLTPPTPPPPFSTSGQFQTCAYKSTRYARCGRHNCHGGASGQKAQDPRACRRSGTYSACLLSWQVLKDPQVMVSTSGAQLLPQDAVRGLIQLLPLTTVVTPNIPEAKLILAEKAAEIRSVDDVEAMARRIRDFGPQWVLIKGGHLPFDKDMKVASADAERSVVVDTLVGPEGQVVRFTSPWQTSTSTHGTGCSLACTLWNQPDTMYVADLF